MRNFSERESNGYRTISRCQLKWGLSKENNSILEVGLLKENKGNKVKYPYMLLFPFIYN